jgi:cyclohexyl-isocyanide hydratase
MPFAWAPLEEVTMHVTMLLYPKLTQLDLIGPFEAFARCPELKIDLVWKSIEPVVDGSGLLLMPTADFLNAPPTDILFVPGGPGQLALMEDEEVLGFLRERASQSKYVTSVCTGSLVLGAAGLLQGYEATCHWLSLEQLALLGAAPKVQRVVTDRNRITGAGVTSGIDFTLTVIAQIYGQEHAELVQLTMEYDPQPPFDRGSPDTARPHILEAVKSYSRDFQQQRIEVTTRAAQNLTA